MQIAGIMIYGFASYFLGAVNPKYPRRGLVSLVLGVVGAIGIYLIIVQG
jgi:hypothetical protein